MIIIRRRLFGVLPYTTVFFPDRREIEALKRVGATGLTRFFWTEAQAEVGERVIKSERTATVCLDLRLTLEKLWQGITKNGRNEIRSVERLADRIRVERNNSDSISDFISIYRTFAVAKEHVSSIDSSTLNRYGNHADCFVVYFDNRPTCGHVYLRDTALGRARLLFSASRRLEDPDTARLCSHLNRLLHWHAITAYQRDGFAIYDFGGVRDDKDDGIRRFKTSFGGTVNPEFTYLVCGSRAVAAIARHMFPPNDGRNLVEDKKLDVGQKVPGRA